MTSRGTRYWDSGAIPLIAPEILGDIITEVSDLALVLTDAGLVLSVLVNPAQDFHRRLDDWEGQDVRQFLERESIVKFDARLAEFLQRGRIGRPVELNHADATATWDFPIRYTFHRIGPDGAILMLGRDLRPIAEMQHALVAAQMALEQDIETHRESDTRFRVLMATTREACVIVSLQTGRVTEINATAADRMGASVEALTDTAFAAAFDLRGRGDLMDALREEASSATPASVPTVLRRNGAQLALTPTLFRAAGDRLLLCRIEAGRGAGPAPGDAVSDHLAALYRQGPDGIVFADAGGTVLSSNDAFLGMVDAPTDLSAKGRGLSDYFARGSVDVRVMIDNAARTGRMRLYPTRLNGAFGAPRAVEVSVTAIRAGDGPVYAFVLREAGQPEARHPAGAPVTDRNARSVMELVGTASLKEIVAETTDVVERMCIETAVELTMNNRVAAAEMLGLSRQSLYVKLRKYDLL